MLKTQYLVRSMKPLINSVVFTEESITDMLVYKLTQKNIKVEKVSKNKERTCGYDFLIEGKIAIQAKKLHKGKYSINYKDQYEVFCKYCKDNNLIGYYLFYNPTHKEVINCANINELDKVLKFKNLVNEICSFSEERLCQCSI